MKITINRPTLEQVIYIGTHLRASDRQEVMASHGHDGLVAARISAASSQFVYVGCADGVPFYLFGLRDGTAYKNTGSVWGLGTGRLARYARSFWPSSQNFISFCRGQCDLLENHVDARNTRSIAWLARLGFRFDEPEPYGIEGRDFLRFWMPGGFLPLPKKGEKDV